MNLVSALGRISTFSGLLGGILFVGGTTLLGLPAASAAPPSPGAIQSNRRDVDAFYAGFDRKLPSSTTSDRDGLPSVKDVQAPRATTGRDGEAQRFWVSKIDIPASQVLSQSVLRELAEPLERRNVRLDELQNLVERINSLYRERNMVTARAILPKQRIVEGVVRIQLIEARVDRVEVTDNRFTRDAYITRRLHVAEGAIADVGELEDALLAFNAVNDVQLKALLQPGSRPETTRYVVQVAEPRNSYLSVFFDNAGRESIGEERVGVSYTNNSLTGRRDRLSAGASHADGTNAGYLVYRTPLNRFGTQAILGLDYSQIAIVAGELTSFDVKGTSTIASAFLSHPLRASPRGSLYGLVGISFKDSVTDFDGVDRFGSAVRAFTIGAEYRRFGDGFILYAHPNLNFGVTSFGGDDRFTTFDADAGVVMRAGLSHQLSLRFSGQLSSRGLLPSAEQFQLGGAASVRGFPEGLLIGDEGYFVSAEYRYAGFAGGRSAWQPFLFADHGGVFGAAAETGGRRLSAVGLGMSYRFGERLTANVQVGVPLSAPPEFGDDYAVHFHISYVPF